MLLCGVRILVCVDKTKFLITDVSFLIDVGKFLKAKAYFKVPWAKELILRQHVVLMKSCFLQPFTKEFDKLQNQHSL